MRKTGIKRRLIMTAGLFALLAGFVFPAAGAPAAAQITGGFSVKAVIPENQTDTRQTYFDLRVKPGDEQTVKVVISNSRAEELVADVRLNNASTGRNGLIVYTEPDIRDEGMKLAVTDAAVLESQRVTVPANGTSEVNINIKIPDEPFEGVVLGGIVVSVQEDGEDASAQQGVTLKNTVSYVIALKLTESDEAADPDFDLAAIAPALVNYRTSVVATLNNKAPRIVKGMKVTAQVFQKGSDALLHDLAVDEAEMAPCSKGDFVIDWGNETLKPGTYRLKMTAVYGGETWEWDEEFTIGGEAGGLNKEAVGIEKDYTWLYVAAGLAVLVIVWLIAFRMGKRRNEEKEG